MGKAGGGPRKTGGKGGGRGRHPYANDYGSRGPHRGGDRNALLDAMLDRERDRVAVEEQEEMIEQLVARIAPHKSSRGAPVPPSSPYRLTRWGRDKKKKGSRAAAAFEDSSSDDEAAQQIASLKEELGNVKAERDSFKKEMLKLAKINDDQPEQTITSVEVKRLIREAIKAGSAASTPKKKLQKAENDGLFGTVDMADDVFHTEAGTAAMLAFLKAKLQEAKDVRDFSLGINITTTLHNQCTKVGKAVAKHHFQLASESHDLLEIRQEFFPTESCKVPGTIMPLVLRALSSRNIAVKAKQIGADLEGNPTSLLEE